MSIEQVKEIRERSNAPLGDCKAALEEARGDIDAALVVLQKRGIAKAVEKGVRLATEGRIHSYIHPGNRIAVIVEVNCETDFVAKNEDFINFCEEVAMQVAGMNAQFVKRDTSSDEANSQIQIFAEQVKNKPAEAQDKIITGKMEKWFSETCLLEQESIHHPKQTIEQSRLVLVAKLGENIQIRRFARMEVGEGMQKKSVDFLHEVARATLPDLKDIDLYGKLVKEDEKLTVVVDDKVVGVQG